MLIRNSGAVSRRQAGRQLHRTDPFGELQCGSAASRTHQQAGQRIALPSHFIDNKLRLNEKEFRAGSWGVYSLVTGQAKWKSRRNVIEELTCPASDTCRNRQREEIGEAKGIDAFNIANWSGRPVKT
jgi:hypothetical protein